MHLPTVLNLFSLPVYKVNIGNDIDLAHIEQQLQHEFLACSAENSQLEKQGGLSTYSSNCRLHQETFGLGVAKTVLQHARMYWKMLDIDSRLEPKIDQCWANIHHQNSITLQHSHSLFPIVATLYIAAEKHAGDLILINPMEYGLTHMPYSVAIENKTETAVRVTTGDLVLFPGWIRHKTQENLSGCPRIVMSFNLGYSGQYLSSNSDYAVTNQPATSEIDQLQNKILNLEFIVNQLKRSIINE